MTNSGDPQPGTVEHYKLHEQCLARINTLTDLLEEIAEECADRADADCVGDPPRFVGNIWAQLHQRIREVVPH
jgi:hypothetical protein